MASCPMSWLPLLPPPPNQYPQSAVVISSLITMEQLTVQTEA